MHQRRVWCTRICDGGTQYHRLSAAAVQPAAPDPPLVHTSISVRCNDDPLKVDTDEERADITTKAMPKGKNDYERFRDDIMNVKGRPAKKS